MTPSPPHFQAEGLARCRQRVGANFRPDARVCGAEINSVASMIDKEYVPADCGLFFLHSDTDDGRNIAAILKSYFQDKGHAPVEAVNVPDLQDQDPKRFRTKGLRNLARKICGVVRELLRGRLRHQCHGRLQGPDRHRRAARTGHRRSGLLHARTVQRDHCLPTDAGRRSISRSGCVSAAG